MHFKLFDVFNFTMFHYRLTLDDMKYTPFIKDVNMVS